MVTPKVMSPILVGWPIPSKVDGSVIALEVDASQRCVGGLMCASE